MNKVSNYILIALLSVLVVMLSFMLFYGIKGKNFKGTKVSLQSSENYILTDVNEINISTKSADVSIKDSDDDKIYVDIYAGKNEKASSSLTDGKLDIELKNKSYFCFMCFGKSYQRRVEIKLPKSYNGKISINTKSGDSNIASYPDASLKLSARSGDINIKDIKNANINVTSGDIEINKVNVAKIKATSGDISISEVNKSTEIKVTSGNIRINDFNIKNNSTIKATSGDIRIKNLSDAFVETSVKSGDVHVNGSNRNAKYELSINVTSGDIRVN